MRRVIASVLIFLCAPQATSAECERMLGLAPPVPIVDLFLNRPQVISATYAPGYAGECVVSADIAIAVPSTLDIDWLDIVLTEHSDHQLVFALDACAMVIDGIAQIRLPIVPGRRYTATVAAYDTEGHKSEPVALELVGPGLSSREWMLQAPGCPHEAAATPEHSEISAQPWPRAIAGVFGGVSMIFVLWILIRTPRTGSREIDG